MLLLSETLIRITWRTTLKWRIQTTKPIALAALKVPINRLFPYRIQSIDLVSKSMETKRPIYWHVTIWWGIFMAILCPKEAQAQSIQLSITDCIRIALEQNLDLKQIINNAAIADLNFQQSKLNYTPSLNGTINYNRNNGTTFNSLTFQRNNTSVDFSAPSINAGMPLFAGLRNYYTYQETLNRLLAAQSGILRVKNTVLFNVLLRYLQLVLDESNMRIVRTRIDVLNQQISRAEKRFRSGAATEADLLNLKAQLANEEVNFITNQNQFERGKWQLLQLLQMDVKNSYVFLQPDTTQLDFNNSKLPALQDVVERAIGQMPEIKEQEYNVKAAEWSILRNRALLMPTLNIFANISSQYTSQVNRFFFEPDRTGYFAQIQDAVQYSAGLQLQIPVLNQWRNRTAYQTSIINQSNSQLGLQISVNTLVRDVQQAYLDVKLANSRYQSIVQQVTANTNAFNFAQKQFENGALDFFQFNQSLNNKAQAELELQRARIDYFFKLKVLDVYQGIPVFEP